MKLAIILVLPFLNNLNDLDPSYKTDLDFFYCFGRKQLRPITEVMRYTKYDTAIISPKIILTDKIIFSFC